MNDVTEPLIVNQNVEPQKEKRKAASKAREVIENFANKGNK